MVSLLPKTETNYARVCVNYCMFQRNLFSAENVTNPVAFSNITEPSLHEKPCQKAFSQISFITGLYLRQNILLLTYKIYLAINILISVK